MSLAAYRADLFMVTLGSYGYTLMTIVFINVLFDNIDSIAGWGKYEMLLLLGVGQILFYLHVCFFSSVDKWVSEIIANGELDLYLLKPVNALFNITTYEFSIFELIPSFMLAITIFSYALVKGNYNPGLFLLLLSGIFIVLGTFLFTLVRLNVALLSFWLTDTRDVRRTYYHIFDLFKYPLEIYPDSLKIVFTTVIPIGIVSYFPAHLIVKGFSWALFSAFMFSLFTYAACASILWKKGLRVYSSASS